MKTVTMTVPTGMEQALRELARAQGGRSVSSIVREALAGYLAAPRPADGAAATPAVEPSAPASNPARP
ncbi:CopG family transcriptional regulator [Luteolibacter ambystomatis]|uniref:CopG family transcriptional regulator n=1 Tax=Luteolibacter ambystomatis TaxID=2824561 RepID=A0A975J2Z3_9BACT|nr:ribbon-helix-helix protein, CopG family [Luteolibacter ambystomatis]QUE53090.1 CopG family transcriptional regulator [Luteolibacter ambystomatis]